MSDQQLDDEPIVTAHWIPPTNDAWGNILHPMTIFQILQRESSPSSEDQSLVIEEKGSSDVST